MAQDVIYPGEGSMCAWGKGEIHCFGVKCPIQQHIKNFSSIEEHKGKHLNQPYFKMCDIHCGKIRCQLQEKKTIKNSNIWRLNNTLLNKQQITEEIKKEIKICIETNENKNTTQNLWTL